MSGLIFNEESLLTNNIFKYEQRLKSATNKYIENGAILTTYYHIHENAVTVDRGTQDIEQLFGQNSPLRFNRIENMPLYGFNQANPTNSEENQVDDITVDGECQILPSTIAPHQNDFFILNHMKMLAIFQIVEVTYDSMKPEGFYKVRYRLHSTSTETKENLEMQTVNRYKCQLDALGTDLNPIITEEDAVRRSQIIQMTNQLITDYRAMFYNERHNCFLFKQKHERWFDLCGNEFIAKHSLMNPSNTTNVVMLHSKLYEPRLPLLYQQSIYRWIEDGSPLRNLGTFPLTSRSSERYITSSFARWSEFDVRVVIPDLKEKDSYDYELFTTDQLTFFREKNTVGSDIYEGIIKLYLHGELESANQISLNTGNILSCAISDSEAFFITPIIIYIIRQALRFN